MLQHVFQKWYGTLYVFGIWIRIQALSHSYIIYSEKK